jgi:MerR family mercuric resistance operon transcriptional regulator
VPTHAFTISKLADAAGIGVEAVRYYQRRGLLQEPRRAGGGFREYARADVQRLRFIKRAQALGFSLDDVAELASLSGERNRRRVREVTQRRLTEIQQRVTQLKAMASALDVLVRCCERAGPDDDCPIIAALAGTPQSSEVLDSHTRSTPTRPHNTQISAVHPTKVVMA